MDCNASHEQPQVEVTQDLVEQTKRKASAVTSQASAVTSGAKGIAQASERQLEALDQANDLLPSVTAATEEALAAFRCFDLVFCEPSCWGKTRPCMMCLL